MWVRRAAGAAENRLKTGLGKRARRTLVCAFLFGLLWAGVVTPVSAEAGRKKHRKEQRPNIVVVMTDDQDAASARFMPQLQKLVARRGVTFKNSVVSYSFCCPSRATLYTGQYAHNHRVLTNKAPHGGYRRLARTVRNTLPVWLQRSGYHTGLIGEFLNGYKSPKVPPGWNEWHAAITSSAYGYRLNENGKTVPHGSPAIVDPRLYETDVFARKAVRFIRRNARRKAPFFLEVTPFAPHAEAPSVCSCEANNPRAAPRHEGAFATLALPKPPSYNEADVSDKPLLTRSMTPMPPLAHAAVTRMYRDRLESLLAVDDLVGKIIHTLKKKGELKNTVIIFTSDNGLMQGEHRWRTGKVLPYEPSIRVPLVMRGPGIPKGRKRRQLVANVDWAPTILDYANARAGRRQDGRSLLGLFRHRRRGLGRAILLESYFNAFGEYANLGPRIVYKGVRTERYMYAKYEDGEEELYDLRKDPFELQSRHVDPSYAAVKASLRRLVRKLRRCAGKACRAARAGSSAANELTATNGEGVRRLAPRRSR